MADLLGIGTSGLIAFQNALTTTGHNISNANTEGYSRQRVETGARLPIRTGPNYIGQGVDTLEIRRISDQFLVEQVRNHTSMFGGLDKFHELASQIDNLLADQKAGLAPAMEEFFGAVQGVADSPSSVPARQVLLSNAESLVDRFHYLDDRLASLDERINEQLKSSVSEVNSLANSISDVNREISTLYSRGANAMPNDLLDTRDLLLEKLSNLVSVDTIEMEDGSVNVFIGTGQNLVVGQDAFELQVTPNDYNPQKLEIGYAHDSGTENLTRFLSGGQLGGLIDFRTQVLEPSQSALGRVALGLADTFNAQHRLGMDLLGDMGLDFFDVASPAVFARSTNDNPALAPTVTVDDVTELTTHDYELRYDGSSWTIADRTNGDSQTLPGTGGGSGTDADPYIYDGMAISVQSLGAAIAGDSYLIQPARSGAVDIGLNIDHTSKIAVASPLRTKTATDASGMLTNAGSGEVMLKSITGTSQLPLTDDITLTYNSGTASYDVEYPAGTVIQTVAYDPATDVGKTALLDGGVFGNEIEIKLSGVPSNGDSFTVQNNWDTLAGNKVPGISDNTNALALGDLQTAKLLENGTVDYMGAYGRMVSSVGTLTHQAEINRDAEDTLLEQAVTQREQASGVNMDEEAANLLKFQQAYQANARVINAAQKMFDSLLAAFM